MSDYEVIKTTKIDGDFEGFDDEVLFKLSDGTYLIQDQYKYWYHYSYSPQVNILRSNGRLYLQVVGQSVAVAEPFIDTLITLQLHNKNLTVHVG